jgi:hypothetical protein
MRISGVQQAKVHLQGKCTELTLPEAREVKLCGPAQVNFPTFFHLPRLSPEFFE